MSSRIQSRSRWVGCKPAFNSCMNSNDLAIIYPIPLTHTNPQSVRLASSKSRSSKSLSCCALPARFIVTTPCECGLKWATACAPGRTLRFWMCRWVGWSSPKEPEAQCTAAVQHTGEMLFLCVCRLPFPRIGRCSLASKRLACLPKFNVRSPFAGDPDPLAQAKDPRVAQAEQAGYPRGGQHHGEAAR